MTVEYTKFGGYAIQEERHDLLQSTQTRVPYSGMEEPPERYDPSERVIVEFQGSQGACQGHGLTTCVEDLVVRAGGQYVQLSRACGYYQSQRLDGIRGDNGSTIAGGVELAMGEGICLESVWPYPNQYDNRIPSAYQDSVRYRAKGHSRIRSHGDAIRHLWKIGPLSIGIKWYGGIDEQVARDGCLRSYKPPPRGGGGHAFAIVGYVPTDWDGRPNPSGQFLKTVNSWSVRWGRKGWFLIAQSAFDQILQHPHTVCEGLVGLKSPDIGPVEV